MAKNLVIVESPAKARTVGRFLGRDYEVKASLGHVRDLPSGDLGVAVDNGFTPKYVVPKGKNKIIADLKKSSKDAETIYLATDPDREGEAISWHLVNAAGWQKRPVQRVVFHQITEDAIAEAFRDTREIDMRLVNAQQARRVLDRLVGYQLSPLLWRKIQRGLSAGRVQSVALKIVVDREREIEAFVSKEYWTIEAMLKTQDGVNAGKTPRFNARLQGVKGQRKGIDIDSEAARTWPPPPYWTLRIWLRTCKRKRYAAALPHPSSPARSSKRPGASSDSPPRGPWLSSATVRGAFHRFRRLGGADYLYAYGLGARGPQRSARNRSVYPRALRQQISSQSSQSLHQEGQGRPGGARGHQAYSHKTFAGSSEITRVFRPVQAVRANLEEDAGQPDGRRRF